MIYTLRFFLFKMQFFFFYNSNIFGFCIIHILYTECAKIKKNNSGAKRLMMICAHVVDTTDKTFGKNSTEGCHAK